MFHISKVTVECKVKNVRSKFVSTERKSPRTCPFSQNVTTTVSKIVQCLRQSQRENKYLLECDTETFVEHPISSSTFAVPSTPCSNAASTRVGSTPCTEALIHTPNKKAARKSDPRD
ncbi:hypothetical protein ISCGN_010417 [Ixodes scapularis]